MTIFDPTRAKQLLLRSDLSVADVAAELGLAERTLHKHFSAATGQSPREWRTSQGVSTGEGASPLVSFRLPEHADLVAAAEEADVTPSAYARIVVQDHLRRRRKRK